MGEVGGREGGEEEKKREPFNHLWHTEETETCRIIKTTLKGKELKNQNDFSLELFFLLI